MDTIGIGKEKRPRISLRNKPGSKLLGIGMGLVGLALVLTSLIFLPVLWQELRFLFSEKTNDQEIILRSIDASPTAGESKNDAIIPVDNDFSLIIPKISANANVIADVDPLDSRIYQRALSKGVAHAKGSAFPGQTGNVFLFAYSSADIGQARRYNAVFYLLSKLEKGDRINVVYQGKLYSYLVGDIMKISSSETRYMQATGDNRLTLMTCWPPGTTMQRLVVVAKESGKESKQESGQN